MSPGAIVAIIVVVIVVAAVAAFMPAAMRRRRLQQRFGPEYDQVVADTGSRRQAEAELAERERRVSSLDIRPLDAASLNRYALQWMAIQEQFVDAPANSVTSAQSLITAVMNDRGYPTEDAGQMMDDLSVDHASTLGHFRAAEEISVRATDGKAGTEDLRVAMVHYRSLFRELLGEPGPSADAGAGSSLDTPARDGGPEHVSTGEADDEDASAVTAATSASSAPLPRER
jgi:hypothetical protein